VSVAVLSFTVSRLWAKGVAATIPFSAMQSDVMVPRVPTDTRTALAFIFNTAFFWPFIEESAYRVAPYLVAGLPGALFGTVAWVLIHYHKVAQANPSLKGEDFAVLAGGYLASLAIPGVYYAFSLTVAPWAPYVFHSAHNLIVATKVAVSLRAPARRGFVKERGSEGEAARPVRAPSRSAAGARVVTSSWMQIYRSLYLADELDREVLESGKGINTRGAKHPRCSTGGW
jgi:hypothetical protein